MRIAKSKWFKPYANKNGTLKPTFKILSQQFNKGCYLIRDKNNTIVYVGYSGSQLQKTLYRHFQSWNDPKQYRATFPKTGYTVRVIFTTAKQAERLEKYLIQRYKPKYNNFQYKTNFEQQPETYSELSQFYSQRDIIINPDEEMPF